MILLLPTETGATMPVDVDRDPDGTLAAVKIAGIGWGVRVLSAAERAAPPDGPRYRPHWAVCPHADAHRTRGGSTSPRNTSWDVFAGVRSGPCVRCRGHNPHLYGPGPASPLCPACREHDGLPPL